MTLSDTPVESHQARFRGSNFPSGFDRESRDAYRLVARQTAGPPSTPRLGAALALSTSISGWHRYRVGAHWPACGHGRSRYRQVLDRTGRPPLAPQRAALPRVHELLDRTALPCRLGGQVRGRTGRGTRHHVFAVTRLKYGPAFLRRTRHLCIALRVPAAHTPGASRLQRAILLRRHRGSSRARRMG